MTQPEVYGIIIINTETHVIQWLESFDTETGEPNLTDAAQDLREYSSLEVAKIAEKNVLREITVDKDGCTLTNYFVSIVIVSS